MCFQYSNYIQGIHTVDLHINNISHAFSSCAWTDVKTYVTYKKIATRDSPEVR
jgi:hypothetical protein